MEKDTRTKEVYKLRLEDLIPIKGWINYHKRCINEIESKLIGDEKYISQCCVRDSSLGVYNFALGIGAAAGLIKGGLELITFLKGL